MLNFGVIGYGYWGPNIVRNLAVIKGARVKAVCDLKAENLNRAKVLYPYVNTFKNHKDIVSSADIDVVAIVTPVSTHFKLAEMALKNGKHIFVEKPFTMKGHEAEKLIRLARKKNLKIMVDHTFIFTGAVRKIKELVDTNVLGHLNYYDSTRISLGLFQHDVNVIQDLATHDFSIMDYVIKNKPLSVTAQGADHMKRGHENLAYIIVYFEHNLIAHINVNWLSPVKVRTVMIGGQKKMLLWDDLQADEKIKIYDKGVKAQNKKGIYRLKVDYRAGDMLSPRLDHTEALKLELEYFVDCIKRNQTPVNDGYAGLRVVKILEAADESLKRQGKMVKL